MDVGRGPIVRPGQDRRAVGHDERRQRTVTRGRKGPVKLRRNILRYRPAQRGIPGVPAVPEDLGGQPVAEIIHPSGKVARYGHVGEGARGGKHGKGLHGYVGDAQLAGKAVRPAGK